MKKSIVAASAMFLATLSFGAFAEDASVNCDTAREDIAKLELADYFHFITPAKPCGSGVPPR